MHGRSSLRSHSSGSSASSMASTFSDIGSTTSSSYSPPNSKTNAFFASPFSTRPPSPIPPPASPPATKNRSLTADFFATSVNTPSPPSPARIFPLRHADRSPDSTTLTAQPYPPSESELFGRPRIPKPRLLLHRDDTIVPMKVDIRDDDQPTPRPTDFEQPMLRFERSLLFKKQQEAIHNPEPPPPAPENDSDEDEGDEDPHPGSIISLPTPDFPPTSPIMSVGNQHLSLPMSPLSLTFIIASPSPIPASSRAVANMDRGTPTPKNANDPTPTNHDPTPTKLPVYAENGSSLPTSPSSSAGSHITHTSASGASQKDTDNSGTPKLRLLRTLGHGAFSAVWLAEDLSPIPLTLVSKKGVRDLRRASGKDTLQKEKERQRGKRTSRGEKEREREREYTSLLMSTDSEPAVVSPRTQIVPTRTIAEKTSAEEASATPRRQPSRLREGLRNMLSFTRSSSSSTSSSSTNSSSIQQQPSPLSPLSSIPFSPPLLLSPMPPMPTLPTMPNTPEGSIRSVRSTHSDVSAQHHEGTQHRSASELLGVSSLDSIASSSPSSIGSEVDGGLRVPGMHHAHAKEQQQHQDYIHIHEPHHYPDDSHTLSPPSLSLSLSRDSSLRKFSKRVKGTRPASVLGRAYLDERHGEMGEPESAAGGGIPGEEPGVLIGAGVGGAGASPLSRHSSLGSGGRGSGRLVAVKMTPKRPARAGAISVVVAGANANGKGGNEKERAKERQLRREEEERTRVGFVREVEVLKHISHPNITPLLAHLSTASHHILVLPYLPGGDLLGLVNNDVAWGKLSESVLRRIWCELCKAVGWMHGVGLVHRDIKLENILLTTPTFSTLLSSSPVPTPSALPPPPAPFIKLTDFGLSRFVEIYENGDAELLATRCGSEAYAAPELVTGTGGGGGVGRGVYDARRTDAWACGVVLYALVGRQLPFGEGVGANEKGGRAGTRIGGERGVGVGGGGGFANGKVERRHWLMRIARGEWAWPGEGDEDDTDEGVEACGAAAGVGAKEEEELVGSGLVKSRGAKRIVSRLLVRDPRKRARIGDLWNDVWMCGEEDGVWWGEKEKVVNGQRQEGENKVVLQHSTASSSAPAMVLPADEEPLTMAVHSEHMNPSSSWSFNSEFGEGSSQDDDMQFYDEPTGLEGFSGGFDASSSLRHIQKGKEEEEEGEEEEEEESDQGYLFDHEGIDSITRQEVI